MPPSTRHHSPLSPSPPEGGGSAETLLPSPGDIRLLLFRLSSVSGVEQAPAILSPDELARADRLLRQDARQRFIAGRLFLRQTLGRCLDLESNRVRLATNQWGKPRLDEEQAGSGLSFNLSHTDDWAILALSRGGEVGVDLELVRNDLEFFPMARRFFSPREQEELFSLPAREQLAAFYCCWTRKEAYLKGVGGGFSIPTDSFHVSLLPGRPPCLTGHRLDPAEIDRWSLADIPFPTGLCGALAVKGTIGAVRFVE